MYRPPLLLAALLAALLAFAATAQAARIVTWSTPSRFVDPSRADQGLYNEPPGVAPRPNALKASIFLPDGYSPRRTYPVLYLLHGEGDSYDLWPHPARGDLPRVAKGFPGIIVMPEGDRGFYTNWWNGGRRGDPAWERYHLDELIPLVERRLPIRRGRRWRAIAGLSMGGEGTAFYASQRPGYFGSMASFSGPLSIQRPAYQEALAATGRDQGGRIFGDPVTQEFYWRGHNPKELVESFRHTRVYVSAGNGVPNPASSGEVTNTFGQLAEAELGMQAREFAQAATVAGVQVTYRPHQGIHDWPYWRRDLANAIDWGFFRPVPERPRNWLYETVAQTGEAWGISFRYDRPPSQVHRLERAGTMLRGTGSGTVSVCTTGGGELETKLPFAASLPRDQSLNVRIRSTGVRRMVKSRRLRVRISVNEPATVELKATVKKPRRKGRRRRVGARRRVTVASAAVRIEGRDPRRSIALKLKRRGRRVLRRLRRAKLRLEARTRDCAGNEHQRRKSKRLRR